MRKVLFFGDAIEQRLYWKNNNQKIANKIKSLIMIFKSIRLMDWVNQNP